MFTRYAHSDFRVLVLVAQGMKVGFLPANLI